MAKKRSDLEHQRVAKAAIKSTRKTTIKKPAKPSRKDHFKKSTKSAVWVVMGVAICIVVVAVAVLAIDWIVYGHSCDSEKNFNYSSTDEILPQAQCRKRSMFFLEDL